MSFCRSLTVFSSFAALLSAACARRLNASSRLRSYRSSRQDRSAMADDSVSVCALRSDVRRSYSSVKSPILRLLGVPPDCRHQQTAFVLLVVPHHHVGLDSRHDKERPFLFADIFFIFSPLCLARYQPSDRTAALKLAHGNGTSGLEKSFE